MLDYTLQQQRVRVSNLRKVFPRSWNQVPRIHPQRPKRPPCVHQPSHAQILLFARQLPSDRLGPRRHQVRSQSDVLTGRDKKPREQHEAVSRLRRYSLFAGHRGS